MRLYDVEVCLDGVERDLQFEVTVEGCSDYCEVSHVLEGTETLTVEDSFEGVMESVSAFSITGALGYLIGNLMDGERLQLVEAIARTTLDEVESNLEARREAEQSAVCGNDKDEVAAAQAALDSARETVSHWQMIRNAVVLPGDLGPDLAETEDRYTEADQRADEADAAAMEAAGERTPHTLGCLTRGTRFWLTSQSLHALHYDERVPATTWGESLTDDTEVWIEELAPAPEADDPTPDTVLTPDDLSSARYLAMAMIHNDHHRPLLIGLLVEAGYAVGKKVS
jgi:hypothetical protein